MTSLLRAGTILLLPLLYLTVPRVDAARTQDKRSLPADRTPGRKLQEKGIPNFGEVTPTLYRGAQPSPEGFEKLARMGINIVVDTGRSKRDEMQIKQLGMQYVPLPWYCPFPKETVFARFLELV